MNGLTVIAPPAELPLNGTEIKAHLRISDNGSEDALIDALIAAAVTHVERSTGRALVTRTLRYQAAGFPICRGELAVPMPPLVAVESVKYYDAGGTLQTLDSDDYYVDDTTTPGRVVPVTTWPSTQCRPAAVQVTYTAGFGAKADVPADLIAALKLIVGHLFENREATSAADLKVVPMAVESLLLEYARPRL
jgi:uncharacterized phiE125 gp8 family phage protein